MKNHQKLSQNRRDAIAKSIHKTIENFFFNKLPSQSHSLCLYYANLGMDVCTHIYQQVTKDTSLSYTLVGGSFSLRIASDPNDFSKGLNFGACDHPSVENGMFHCWVVGLCQDGKILTPFEFIDFTSKDYKLNAKEQGYNWERSDIGDYLWLDDQDEMEKFGVSVKSNNNITQEARKKWQDLENRNKLFKEAIENYLEIMAKS